MAGIISAVRKSFRIPKIEDHVRLYNESEPGTEKRRNAIWGIRDNAEKKKNPGELINLGVIPIMVKTINEYKGEERLWALWVLRYLSDFEEAAPMILSEPDATEGLIKAIRESNVGSEAAKRTVECVEHLSKHLSTQIMLARDDMFDALAMAMAAAPVEAATSMRVYYSLSEAETGGSPPFIAMMKKPDALASIKGLSNHPKLSPDDRQKAEKLYAHLSS